MVDIDMKLVRKTQNQVPMFDMFHVHLRMNLLDMLHNLYYSMCNHIDKFDLDMHHLKMNEFQVDKEDKHHLPGEKVPGEHN